MMSGLSLAALTDRTFLFVLEKSQKSSDVFFWKSLVSGVSSLKIGGLRRKQQFWDEIDNGALSHHLLPKIPHK